MVGVRRGKPFRRLAGQHHRSRQPHGSSAGGQLACGSVGIDVVGRSTSSSAPAPAWFALSVGDRSIAGRLRSRHCRSPPPLMLVAFLWAAGPLPGGSHSRPPARHRWPALRTTALHRRPVSRLGPRPPGTLGLRHRPLFSFWRRRRRRRRPLLPQHLAPNPPARWARPHLVVLVAVAILVWALLAAEKLRVIRRPAGIPVHRNHKHDLTRCDRFSASMLNPVDG